MSFYPRSSWKFLASLIPKAPPPILLFTGFISMCLDAQVLEKWETRVTATRFCFCFCSEEDQRCANICRQSLSFCWGRLALSNIRAHLPLLYMWDAATAWLAKQCHVRIQDPNRWTLGCQSGMWEFNHCTTGPAPKATLRQKNKARVIKFPILYFNKYIIYNKYKI